MTRESRLSILTATTCALALLAGCGLKAPLSLPEKSERVIIRTPQGQTGTTTGATTGTTSTPTGANPTPASKPEEERQPPPPLPGGNPGTSRGE
jgi:predicted small lipoprotein YifL